MSDTQELASAAGEAWAIKRVQLTEAEDAELYWCRQHMQAPPVPNGWLQRTPDFLFGHLPREPINE